MATVTVAYDTKETESWFLKLSVLGRPFIIAFKVCIKLKKAIEAKLARFRSQAATAEICSQKTTEQGATVESRTIRNWNCVQCCLRFIKHEDTDIEDTIDPTKISSFTEFRVPKRRKWWHILSKKHREACGQKEVTKEILRRNFTMEELEEEMASMGFGGPNNQFKDIILSLVLPRTLPRDLSRELRLQPMKGLIIYGPPGTGKTLVARCISEILNAKLKVVRGPEIISTFLGSGEKNLRDIFAPSIRDLEQMGEESPVHVIIFEEIDAFAAKRGANSVTDRIVSQLSTLVDGVREQTNLLVVGTTSRIELIDDGLLRPGRFELLLQLGLPDEDARLRILQVKAKRMQRRFFFDTDIDLSAIASATEGLSLVDVEGLLQTALESALFRGFQGRLFKAEDIQIKKVDIQMALNGFGRDLK
ncbi:vesicular-fusion protein sec18-like isoform X2 [Nicotiana tabacum]|uniref:Vesicular-fusion protein sec18-like isoform X2 n=1 Tax=Nicotiana tabacum TaxID=4097 RepID=A0AC58SBN4_TOBAC